MSAFAEPGLQRSPGPFSGAPAPAHLEELDEDAGAEQEAGAPRDGAPTAQGAAGVMSHWVEDGDGDGDDAAPPAGGDPAKGAAIGDIARGGLAGSGGPLPHLEAVQRAFGRHDVSGIRAHTDAPAAQAAGEMGARAYAYGNQVAFSGAPSLHTAAHEAAHVVQQAAGVHLSGGVGQKGDRYEVNADAVADAVVQGRSAEPLLDQITGGGGGGGGKAVQGDVGFEFQTGWGVARSVPQDYKETRKTRAEDPDPLRQSDWEDVPVEHLAKERVLSRRAPTRSLHKTKLGRPSPLTNWGQGFHSEKTMRPTGTSYILPSMKKSLAPKLRGSRLAFPTKGRKQLKLHKGQVLKDFGTHRLCVDDATTPLGAELEWVVHPPIKESAGVEQVTQIMTQLQNTCQTMLNFAQRESFLLSEVTQSPADDQIEIQPGVKGVDSAAEMKGAPQATVGVRMDRLANLFEHQAQQVPGKPMMKDQEDPHAEARTLKKSIGGDTVAVAMHGAAGRCNGSPELKGLVAFIQRYVDMGKGHGPLDYAKVNTQFLARTDFAKMFDLLPRLEWLRYRNDPQQFQTDVLEALGDNTDPGRKVFVGGIKGLPDQHNTLTVGDWIKNIALGTDRLTGEYWKSVSEHGQTEPEKEGGRAMAPHMESMGSLGDKTDKVGPEGTRGPTGEGFGAVMELRGNTAPIPMVEWRPYAVRIFNYIKDLNSR